MTTIVAIDPGPMQSAWIVVERSARVISSIVAAGIDNNKTVFERLNEQVHGPCTVAIEFVACMGMPVGAEVFETCVWVGRFIEQLRCEPMRVYRRDVKMYLCGSMRAKDGNIRQALIDKYGIVGTKKNPGMLYGIRSHLWAALAVADYAAGRA